MIPHTGNPSEEADDTPEGEAKGTGNPSREENGSPTGEVKDNPTHNHQHEEPSDNPAYNGDGATHPETHFIGESMECEEEGNNGAPHHTSRKGR